MRSKYSGCVSRDHGADIVAVTDDPPLASVSWLSRIARGRLLAATTQVSAGCRGRSTLSHIPSHGFTSDRR
jgi:hypothetical protein